jgi:hypothetical protein
VRCSGCDERRLIQAMIVVEVPDEDKRFFHEGVCLFRWAREIV